MIDGSGCDSIRSLARLASMIAAELLEALVVGGENDRKAVV
jgi:hypothetical protein